MRDKGLNKGLVQSFDTSSINTQNVFFGFRKMFRDYLNKLNVGFYDSCCPQAAAKLAIYVDPISKEIRYIDPATGQPVTLVAFVIPPPPPGNGGAGGTGGVAP